MNTNQLKKFACEARNILKKGIRAKIQTLGFNDKGEVPERLMPQKLQGGTIWNGGQYPEGFYDQWMAIYHCVADKGIQEVYEEAAYTWFNRLMAIRILQKNAFCEPVLVYTNEARTPRIVDEARMGRLPQMKEDARRHLMDLLEDDTKVTEQFAILITAWCHNNPLIQACFGGMDDFTELLLPINILAEGGFVDMLNHTEFITDEDFHSPELIGWLYQFYISERKDEVFAKKGKFEADEIPAATQIFTPNWIVKYMVQNTVGRIYLDNNPGTTAFHEKWKYLVEQEPSPKEAIYHYDELTDLKVADLASGSGHILNECFDLLYDLYVYEGYSRSEAVENIFTKNLTGIDLDNRAKQLSMFALMVKACQKDGNFVDAHCLPHVLTMPKALEERETETGKIIPSLDAHLRHFCQDEGTSQCYKELKAAFELMQNVYSLGSIMKFDISKTTRLLIEQMVAYWEEQKYQDDAIVNELMPGMKLILALTTNYSALIMNPPYMGANHMEDFLLDYSKKNYPLTSNDLGAIFMDVAFDSIGCNGKFGMINQAAWLLKPAYKEYRLGIINRLDYNLDSALYLGPNTFPELKGEVVQSVSFISSKSSKRNTTFFYLKEGQASELKRDALINHQCKLFNQNISDFIQLEGCQFGFWLNNDVKSFFKSSPIKKYGDAKQGLKTGNNNYFIRLWFEVSHNKIGKKWYPVETGGSFRKWYGNGISILNWENDGFEIKNFKDEKGKLRSRPQGLQYSFKEGITWSTSAGDNPSFRYSDERFLFESSGSKFFLFSDSKELSTFCAYFNSYVVKDFIEMLSPGLGVSEGAIKSLPFIEPSSICNLIALSNIEISKQDWDSHESSWDFQTNELLAIDESTYMDNIHNEEQTHFKETGEHICIDPAAPQLDSLEWRLEQYKQKWQHKFMQLHVNEEELNRQFIDIYGLQDELTPDVPLSEITILQQGEINIDNDEIQWNDDVVMKQLISYAVGTWMGRYRLDKPGLHIAHPNPTREELDSYEYHGETIEIDDDGIIPLLPKDCGFNDNAAQRLSDFTRQAFGNEMHVVNLNYIEKCLGKTIEQYFIKDFWKDHKKMYQNRPIYWLFSSKKGAFQCLVYMHRMTPYTAERVRSKYLLPYIEHLQAKANDMESRASSLTTAENRQLATLNKQLEECQEYHERLQVVAEHQIGFGLDDGVVVNYAKFGDVLAKIK